MLYGLMFKAEASVVVGMPLLGFENLSFRVRKPNLQVYSHKLIIKKVLTDNSLITISSITTFSALDSSK